VQVAIDSATPIDDAGPSGNFMMSGPEPFGSYAGPMRNFGRMYGTLDYDDASAYMVPSKVSLMIVESLIWCSYTDKY
jgi:RNA-binding protein Musashi